MRVQLGNRIDIALVASDAAVELDELLRGKHPSLVSVRRLTAALPRLLRAANVPSGTAATFDPGAVVVVSRAFDDANWSAPLHTTSDLAAEAAGLTDKLRHAEAASQTEFLTKFRDFCLALAKTAIAYGHSFEDLDPPTLSK